MKSIGIILVAVAVTVVVVLRLTEHGAKMNEPAPIVGDKPAVAAPRTVSLAEARRGFKTVLMKQIRSGDAVDSPPKGLLDVVKYDSAVGPLAAYLTPDPRDGRKHPAIIWITGGDCNSIGDVWTRASAGNDQTASAYRQAGIVMMYPSSRGGNQNPGMQEKFLGEVDDVIAAADFLAHRTYVDPNRIYLGGHSTGGTLVLLVSECTDRFRSVFSFGPVADVTSYGKSIVDLPFDRSDQREVALRAPGRWLQGIKSPTFIFEGAKAPSNARSVQLIQQQPSSSAVHISLVAGVTHFSVLAPTNRLIAQKVLHDDGPTSNIHFSDEEIAAIGRP